MIDISRAPAERRGSSHRRPAAIRRDGPLSQRAPDGGNQGLAEMRRAKHAEDFCGKPRLRSRGKQHDARCMTAEGQGDVTGHDGQSLLVHDHAIEVARLGRAQQHRTRDNLVALRLERKGQGPAKIGVGSENKNAAG